MVKRLQTLRDAGEWQALESSAFHPTHASTVDRLVLGARGPGSHLLAPPGHHICDQILSSVYCARMSGWKAEDTIK